GSRSWPTRIRSWASPWNPCSGPNRAANWTPGAWANRSTAGRRCSSTAAACVTRPIRKPRQGANSWSRITASPGRTRELEDIPRSSPAGARETVARAPVALRQNKIQHRMQFHVIGGVARLIVWVVKKAHARDQHRRVGIFPVGGRLEDGVEVVANDGDV